MAKLILVGDAGVGKSSLLSRILKRDQSVEYQPTLNVQSGECILKNATNSISVVVHDFPGSAVQQDHKAEYAGAKAAVVMYDVSNPTSLESVPRYLNVLKESCGDISVAIVGNKADLGIKTNQNVPSNNPSHNHFSAVSVSNGMMVDDVLDWISQKLSESSNSTQSSEISMGNSTQNSTNPMEINFKGKRALVTGAGKGIGRDIAILLAELGCDVVAISRSQEDLDSLANEIKCSVIQCDLADASAASAAAELAGQVDFLVNSAGIALNEPFLEAKVENFSRTLDVNVRGVFVVSQIVARSLIKSGKRGAIVNLSSQASMVAIKDHTSYCTSKGALDQLTRMMALELGPYGIRVNAVNPTVVLTPMGEANWSDPAKSGPMKAQIPLGRFAKPREVSEAVAFLLSDRASMINGTLLPIDGGFLAC